MRSIIVTSLALTAVLVVSGSASAHTTSFPTDLPEYEITEVQKVA